MIKNEIQLRTMVKDRSSIAEAQAKRGPHSSSVDQLVAKGRSFVERLRARFARK